MDDSISWRPYARRLQDGWRIIALTAAVAVVVAALLTFVTSERYSAEAVLAVAKPESVLRFDERFGAPETNPAFPYSVNTLRTYAELAMTPTLAEAVAGRLAEASDYVVAPEQLMEMVHVSAMADGSLIAVEARADVPELAAAVANAWAETFSSQMAEVFGSAAEEHPVERARVEAGEALEQAEDALADFHSVSPLPALEGEVANLQARQRRLLEASDRLTAVERDLEALRSQAGESSTPDVADKLAALTLQLNALTSGAAETVDLDVQVAGLDVGVGELDLDALSNAVAQSRTALDQALDAAPEELAERTAQLERERAQLARLQRTRSLAEERYMTLSRKADELDVARETARPELRMAAPATVPSGPDWSPMVHNVIVAALVGLVLGGILALVLGSHRPGDDPTA
jgi:uncharacterized protein involved in exopolysaccharide biosynthesis